MKTNQWALVAGKSSVAVRVLCHSGTASYDVACLVTNRQWMDEGDRRLRDILHGGECSRVIGLNSPKFNRLFFAPQYSVEFRPISQLKSLEIVKFVLE